jgi:diguanylate cyclase (GGDEF)-like protein
MVRKYRMLAINILLATGLFMLVLFAGQYFEGHVDGFVLVAAVLSAVMFFLVIHGYGVYRQVRARQHTADLISDALSGNAAEVDLVSPDIPTCWQERACYFKQCPVYGREHMRCWLVDGTFCRGEVDGSFPEKMDYCYECTVFQTAVDESPAREMEERFYGLMYLLNDREKKVEKLYRGSEVHREMLEFLLNLSRKALSSLELDALLELVAKQMSGEIADFAAFFIIDKDGKLRLHAGDGFREGSIPRLVVDGGTDFVQLAMAGERIMTSSNIDNEPWIVAQFLERKVPTSVIGVPLINRGQKLGLLLAGNFQRESYSDFDKQVMQVAADQIAMAVSNASMYASVSLEAATDGLTGLTNHRSFFEVLDKELGRSSRYGHPVSLIMADIDNFKDFNDAYGHPQGDKVLSEVASVIRNSVRIVDTAARYGGEEFAVLLPETPYGTDEDIAGSAMQVAERMRQAVEEHSFEGRPGKRDVRLTISLGVAENPTHAAELVELVNAADSALYRAKDLGRNRVELADESPRRHGVG